MPIRTPFQGDFLVRVVPRAEALGCSLFALRAIGTCTRKCPNSTAQKGLGKPRPPSVRYGAPSSSGQHGRIIWPRRRPCGVVVLTLGYAIQGDVPARGTS